MEVGAGGAPGIHEKGQQDAIVLSRRVWCSLIESTKGFWFLKFPFLFSWHWYTLRRGPVGQNSLSGSVIVMCAPVDRDLDGDNSSSDNCKVAPWLWFPGEIVQ